MSTWGDVTEVSRYLKKAQALDAKLQQASEKIDAINVEETAFDWEQTNYPRRAEILAAMKPFHALYETATDFETKRNEWLFGPRANLQPDDIEQVLLSINQSIIYLYQATWPIHIYTNYTIPVFLFFKVWFSCPFVCSTQEREQGANHTFSTRN